MGRAAVKDVLVISEVSRVDNLKYGVIRVCGEAIRSCLLSVARIRGLGVGKLIGGLISRSLPSDADMGRLIVDSFTNVSLKGNPLTGRFGFSMNHIRWGWLAWRLGMARAKTLWKLA